MDLNEGNEMCPPKLYIMPSESNESINMIDDITEDEPEQELADEVEEIDEENVDPPVAFETTAATDAVEAAEVAEDEEAPVAAEAAKDPEDPVQYVRYLFDPESEVESEDEKERLASIMKYFKFCQGSAEDIKIVIQSDSDYNEEEEESV